MRSRAFVLIGSMLAPIGWVLASPLPAGAGPTVDLTISNFRYCQRSVCLPTDQGYGRTASGPNGDGPAPPVVVHAGDTVVWTYDDATGCDAFYTANGACPGHEARLDDGTPDGTPVGFAGGALPTDELSRTHPTITYTVPATATSGTQIHYYCNINAH